MTRLRNHPMAALSVLVLGLFMTILVLAAFATTFVRARPAPVLAEVREPAVA